MKTSKIDQVLTKMAASIEGLFEDRAKRREASRLQKEQEKAHKDHRREPTDYQIRRVSKWADYDVETAAGIEQFQFAVKCFATKIAADPKDIVNWNETTAFIKYVASNRKAYEAATAVWEDLHVEDMTHNLALNRIKEGIVVLPNAPILEGLSEFELLSVKILEKTLRYFKSKGKQTVAPEFQENVDKLSREFISVLNDFMEKRDACRQGQRLDATLLGDSSFQRTFDSWSEEADYDKVGHVRRSSWKYPPPGIAGDIKNDIPPVIPHRASSLAFRQEGNEPLTRGNASRYPVTSSNGTLVASEQRSAGMPSCVVGMSSGTKTMPSRNRSKAIYHDDNTIEMHRMSRQNYSSPAFFAQEGTPDGDSSTSGRRNFGGNPFGTLDRISRQYAPLKREVHSDHKSDTDGIPVLRRSGRKISKDENGGIAVSPKL